MNAMDTMNTMDTISSNLAAGTIQTRELQTPVGLLTVAATERGIISILFVDNIIDATSHLQASSAKTPAPRLAVLKVLTPINSKIPRPPVGNTTFNTAPSHKAETHLQQAIEQLQQYFTGERQHFSLSLAPVGSSFQQQVWQALCAIPFAHSCSYGTIANHLQNPRAVRAVGAANGRNPIAIVVPCHRVIGANGNLTGYAGGLNRKLWLLQHERQVAGAESLPTNLQPTVQHN